MIIFINFILFEMFSFPSSHLHPQRRSAFASACRAFSLIEVLAAIFTLGIVATIAFVAVGDVTQVARGEKLHTDVATLNSAIGVYLANGGSLDGITTADQVLAKLKTTRDGADLHRHTGGPGGRMIDPRIIAVPVAGGTGQLRASYDATARKFEIVDTGSGVRFDLDASLGETQSPIETREHGAVQYAGSDSWVWDYNNSLTNPTANPGLTSIPLSREPVDSAPPTSTPVPDPDPDPIPDPDPDPPVDPRVRLGTPWFNPPGGQYPRDSFPLSVTIGNAPDPGIGKLIYRVGNGGWQDYAGQTLALPQNTELQAQAVSLDTANYLDSWVASGFYTVPDPPKLPTPIFNLSGGAYPRQNFPLSLTLNNRPDPTIANAVYQVGGGGWLPYSGPINVPKNSEVQARYETSNEELYQTSGTRTEYYYPVATDLSGSVTGSFNSPTGGPKLVYEFSGGNTFFSHGNPQMDLGGEIIDAGEPNTLRIEPANFGGITPGEAFKIGDLHYHNGTTFNDSHATGVKLRISIALADPAQNIAFDLNFDLVNTENSDNPAASADFVRLTNLTQNIHLSIDDVSYALQLSFGGTDSFGFSTTNQFHVYEGATGRGTINGTFITRP